MSLCSKEVKMGHNLLTSGWHWARRPWCIRVVCIARRASQPVGSMVHRETCCGRGAVGGIWGLGQGTVGRGRGYGGCRALTACVGDVRTAGLALRSKAKVSKPRVHQVCGLHCALDLTE